MAGKDSIPLIATSSVSVENLLGSSGSTLSPKIFSKTLPLDATTSEFTTFNISMLEWSPVVPD
jgi:hypothetical protein